ncbi:transcriptional regulator [Methylomonas sp. Kb3]|uniref:helix-turn-helix domain-containing protein n=1 Tax=Methylomonas sp. Kb3 TaxID=1611544 RepID=UPI000C33A2E0|nr:helix-turn-helix domain-containing protein [Methylomonas sp. Kb3]PKD39861.1 transcriptional regulator [Methylomonas sp. Kb3]
MYNQIFFTNVLRLLEEKCMTKEQLAAKSGVSESFIGDLTRGKGNPSLRVMEQLANALDVDLPSLLIETDMDAESLRTLAGGKISGVPDGYSRVSVILPDYQAFLVKKWAQGVKSPSLTRVLTS